jgi:hypothetical protein
MTPKIDLRELARRGAQETIKELVQHFGPSIVATTATPRSTAPAAPVRRRAMTPAQKREVSRRMKKYWASRRKAGKHTS